jgi:dethiobiotin synthetase
MRKYKNLFVAATSQHIGKTTTTLGLAKSFLNANVNVGYCKPVGQQYVNLQKHKVDKDTVLFSDLIGFEIDPVLHSPVIFTRGTTEQLLDNPDAFALKPMIEHAKNELNKQHELTIFEGTGHPGVGTIANLSNARVAKILDAGVIMVVEGGIGSSIDMLNMTTSLFREEGVEILGVIVNKVLPSKAEKVELYLDKWLSRNNLKLLGVLPYDETLAYPLVRTICAAIKGEVLMHQENMFNRVANVIGGSLMDLKEFKPFKDLLLLTGARLIDRAIKRVISYANLMELDYCPLSGIVITGDGKISDESLEYVKRYQIPVIKTKLETYGVGLKISRLEVKINRRTPWKVARAIDLVEQYVDVNWLKSQIIL